MEMKESFHVSKNGNLIQLRGTFIVLLYNYKRLANILLLWWIYE